MATTLHGTDREDALTSEQKTILTTYWNARTKALLDALPAGEEPLAATAPPRFEIDDAGRVVRLPGTGSG